MDAKARDRCLKEVKLLQTLPPHPCIIRYIDAFIDSPKPKPKPKPTPTPKPKPKP